MPGGYSSGYSSGYGATTFTPDTYGVPLNAETQGGEGEQHSMWRHFGTPIQVGYTVLITSGVATTAPGTVSPDTNDIRGNSTEVPNATATYSGVDTGSGEGGLAWFRGGITYAITNAEQTILQTAGYTMD